MQVKSVIKIVILSFFTVVIVIYGIMFYQRLNFDRQIYDVDVHSYIPVDVSQVLQVNKTLDLDKLAPFIVGLENLLPRIENSLTFPYYVVNTSGDGLVVMSKLNTSQQEALKRKIEIDIFPAFPPQKKKYKDAELLFYTTAKQSEFFVCTFFEGVFIGGYNYKSIEDAINTRAKAGINFFSNNFFNSVTSLMQGTYPASVYINSDGVLSAYNILYDKTVNLTGYRSDCVSEESDVDSLNIDFSVFPNNVKAFGVERNLEGFSDSLRYLFHPPYYQFYTDVEEPIHAMAFDIGRYKLYDLLNAVERKLGGRDLVRHGYTVGKKYSIYSGSTKFNEDVFQSDQTIYFVFKDDYMAYSKNRANLTKYILNSGNFKKNFVETINPHFETYFFTQNLLKLSHPFYPTEYYSTLKSDTVGLVKVHHESKFFKIELLLNNSVDNLFKIETLNN